MRYWARAIPAVILLLLAIGHSVSAENHPGRSGLRYGFCPSVGEVRVLVLLMNFADTKPTIPRERFEELYFSRGKIATGSMAEYFDDASMGRLKLTGQVFGWYTASQAHDFYSPKKHGLLAETYPSNMERLVEEAVEQAAAAGVDFSIYDNDRDGHVDSLIVVHQGPGGDTSGKEKDLWSTIGYLSEKGAGPKQVQGLIVDRFVVVQELWKGAEAPIGFVSHEFGHLLGLPDLYDYDRKSSGIGLYGLMSAGMWAGEPTRPAHPEAYSKALLGWVNPQVIGKSGPVELKPAEQSPEAIRINTGHDREYFLLENRQRLGYDKGLPAAGLFIWHVDEKVLEQNLFECAGCCEKHARLALEQADGSNHLETGANWGDSQDAFPGPRGQHRAFGGDTGTGPDKRKGAHSLDYNCDITGIRVDEIKEQDQKITARVTLGDKATPFKSPDLRVLKLRWQEISGNGNGRPDPGEELKLFVSLHNNGEKGKGLKLLASADGIRVSPGSVKLSKVERGESVEADEPFTVSIPREPVAPHFVEIKFEVHGKNEVYVCGDKTRALVGTPEILVLDDSAGLLLARYYRTALDKIGVPFMVHDVAQDGLPAAGMLGEFKTVIWSAGLQGGQGAAFPDQPRQELIRSFLSRDKNLLLVAANLMNMEQAGSAFMREVFHVEDLAGSAGIGYIKGLSGDPISRGISAAVGSLYFPDLSPHAGLRAGAGAAVVLNDPRGPAVAVRYPAAGSASYKAVLMTFPLEALPDNTRAEIIGRTLLMFNNPPGVAFMDAVNPAAGQPGEKDLMLSISGANFQSGLAIDLGQGITIKKINIVDPGQMQVWVDISPGAGSEQRDVRVINPGSAPATLKKAFMVSGPRVQ